MSEETRLVVEGLLAAYAGENGPDMDAVGKIISDDHVWIAAGGPAVGGEFAGKRSYLDWVRETNEMIPFWTEAHGVVDLGPGRAMAVVSVHFSSATGGASGTQRMWILFTVADGKVTKSEAYTDPVEALEAATR